jgi:hypothetical protein
MQSEDGKYELTLREKKSEGILDGSMLVTVAKPGSPFDDTIILSEWKRARDPELYWINDNEIVFSARDFDGWLHSNNNGPHVIICGLSREACGRELPRPKRGQAIMPESYASGESEPFI